MSSALLKWLGVGAAILVAIPPLLYVARVAQLQSAAERRILDALAEHYAPASIEITKREDWTFGRNDFTFGGQICFAVTVRKPSGQTFQRVAMVADYDDGGAFAFTREYPSFEACKNDFMRG
ncbi:hypothetical protein [Phenylobacterium sp.]|uniref:hypothetical protein n=1 Tax=Phenylobacterium sp. TaxID=1871053 RepID=UPI00272F5BC6|nr:hypothetical protein [Phenylobacterium sp.]MDP2213226.1 hypothetical protein [Phenylobacterium sp.]